MKNHPSSHMAYFLQALPRTEQSTVEYSLYIPDTDGSGSGGKKEWDDKRQLLPVDAGFTPPLVGPKEVGLNSRLGNGLFHIPMLDLKTKSAREAQQTVEALKRELGWSNPGYIYSSGLSHHVYFERLLTYHAWVTFMVTAALVEGVDDRWCLHSLKRGYACLRWSHNIKKGEIKFVCEV